MFPGTSTLQRHAKYFVLLPHLYKEAIRHKYVSIKDVYKKIIDLEILLTKRLMEGSPNEVGITGSDMVERFGSTSQKYVKYDPTYIYLNGMKVFDIVKTNSLYQLIYKSSLKYEKRPNRYTSTEEGESDDQISTAFSGFCISPLNNIDLSKPISLELTNTEAYFLKNQIIKSNGSKDSLFAYIQKNDYPMDRDFFKFYYDDLPDTLKNQYLRAKDFSIFIQGLYIRYNYIFSESRPDGANPELLERFESYIQENANVYTHQALDNITDLIVPLITESSVLYFCNLALNAILSKDFETLDNLIIRREIKVKSASRSKLRNPKTYQYQPIHQDMNTFRWEISNTLINEIREGLING